MEDDVGLVLKVCICINGRDVVVYFVYLDYMYYVCYLLRGYSGVIWKKLDVLVLDVVVIEKVNNEFMCDEVICYVIEDV